MVPEVASEYLVGRHDSKNVTAKYARKALVAQMYNRYKYGGTLSEIGREFGISGERVRQLINAGGYETMLLAERRMNASRARSAEIIAAYKRLGSVEDAARAVGIPPDHVKEILNTQSPDNELQRKYAKHINSRPRKYTDRQIIEAIRNAAKVTGEPLARVRYSVIASTHGFPAELTILRAFGTWQEACERAGVKTNAARGTPKGLRTFGKADCDAALQACEQEIGSVPSLREYNEWRDGRKDVPSSMTITVKFAAEDRAAWSAALRSAFPDDPC
jgi:predicted transcriptional regulator